MELAGMNSILLNASQKIAGDVVAITSSPKGLDGRLGPIANLRYKLASFHYAIEGAFTGVATVRLKAG